MKFLPVLLLALITALRLGAAAMLPVTPEEAYHWMSAARLDWAFFDGPGGTAALAQLGPHLLGDGPLGLRLAFPPLAALASIGAYLLGRAWFGSAAGLWAAVALNALPAFNLAAVHVGPEIPALAFAALGLWAVVRAVDHGLRWWLTAGLFLVIGEQFSYAVAASVPGILLALAISSRHRAEWHRPGLYVFLALVGAGTLPEIGWNQAHGWPATALGTCRTEFTPPWPEAAAALRASVAGLSLPATVVALFALGALGRSARLHARPRLVLCFAGPFLFLWLHGILHGDPARAALLLATIVLVAGAAGIFLETKRRRLAGAVALVLTAGITALAPPPKPEPWMAVAAALGPILAQAQATRPAPLFLIAPDPAATAALSYHLARTTEGSGHPVFLRESQDLSNQFGLWPRYDDFVPTATAPDELFQEVKAVNPYLGRSALYLTDEEPTDLPQTITAAFARVTPHAALLLPGGRKLRVYLCEDYQTMPL